MSPETNGTDEKLHEQVAAPGWRAPASPHARARGSGWPGGPGAGDCLCSRYVKGRGIVIAGYDQK